MSEATVSMRAYVNTIALILSLGFAAVIVTLDRRNAEAVSLALAGQKEATRVAMAAAEAKGIQHNGLIERMREMSATYITRGNVYSALITTIMLASVYFASGAAR